MECEFVSEDFSIFSLRMLLRRRMFSFFSLISRSDYSLSSLSCLTKIWFSLLTFSSKRDLSSVSCSTCFCSLPICSWQSLSYLELVSSNLFLSAFASSSRCYILLLSSPYALFVSIYVCLALSLRILISFSLDSLERTASLSFFCSSASLFLLLRHFSSKTATLVLMTVSHLFCSRVSFSSTSMSRVS